MLTIEEQHEFLLAFTQDILEKGDLDEILSKVASAVVECGSFSKVIVSAYDRPYHIDQMAGAVTARKVTLEIGAGCNDGRMGARNIPCQQFEFPIQVREMTHGLIALQTLERKPSLMEEESQFFKMISRITGFAVAQNRARQELERLAIQDPLTGCYNRRYLCSFILNKISWAKRYGRALSLVILDLDNFKSVNDTYGHLTGDDVLKTFGALLAKNVRLSDLVCRYGGDEFAIVLPETSKDHAKIFTERLKKIIEKYPFKTDRKHIKIAVGIGISSFGEDGETMDELIGAADKDCYLSKSGCTSPEKRAK